ncbi:MAG: hypothetical protein AB4050_15375 [Synechococcus sp.]
MTPQDELRLLLQLITAATVLAESPVACIAGILAILYLLWKSNNNQRWF